MFSLFSKARLHSFGEVINRYRFWWTSPPTVETDWDFGGAQPAQLALAAPSRRRRLQPLVHVPDPDARSSARSG